MFSATFVCIVGGIHVPYADSKEMEGVDETEVCILSSEFAWCSKVLLSKPNGHNLVVVFSQ